VNYKEHGFAKLRAFLCEFSDILELREDQAGEGKPPVIYARVLKKPTVPAAPAPASAPAAAPVNAAASAAGPEEVRGERQRSAAAPGKREPSKNTELNAWAIIHHDKYRALADMALEEKWYYGDGAGLGPDDLPILRNYLKYTFHRLAIENKIRFGTDEARGDEYAAFNTGLVDKKYEYIYALFKKNTRVTAQYSQYWYLLDFVVAGENIGKTLVAYINPLPERADYFEGKIQNMLFDTSTGDLSCDYEHIIAERTERFPREFLEDNCPDDFLTVNGVTLDSIYEKRPNDPARRQFFRELGEKISSNPRILKRLKNRVEDAIELAIKRVEWNYKTAIPMYYPTRNCGSLLLPLCLVDEDCVDLALVVERTPSGAYQGQTVLTLDLAYSDSRLVTRPDSDWLKTDSVQAGAADDLDDD